MHASTQLTATGARPDITPAIQGLEADMSDVETHNPYAPPTAHVASPADTGLKRRSVWLMVLLIVITLGFYYPVWFLRRRQGLNRLNSPRKLPLWPMALFAVYFVVVFLMGLVTGATPDQTFGAGAGLLIRLVELAVGIMMIIQCFRIKDIIEDHTQGPDDAPRDELFTPPVKLSGLMTFFFSIFYLQYAINKYVIGAGT
jgi:hypothetical protein